MPCGCFGSLHYLCSLLVLIYSNWTEFFIARKTIAIKVQNHMVYDCGCVLFTIAWKPIQRLHKNTWREEEDYISYLLTTIKQPRHLLGLCKRENEWRLIRSEKVHFAWNNVRRLLLFLFCYLLIINEQRRRIFFYVWPFGVSFIEFAMKSKRDGDSITYHLIIALSTLFLISSWKAHNFHSAKFG